MFIFVKVVVLIIVGVLALFLGLKETKFIPGAFLLFLGSAILLSFGGLEDKKSTQFTATFCEDNSISYDLVQTVAEYTGQSEQEIAYVFCAGAREQYEITDCIKFIDSDISEEEALAIIKISDNKQKEGSQ